MPDSVAPPVAEHEAARPAAGTTATARRAEPGRRWLIALAVLAIGLLLLLSLGLLLLQREAYIERAQAQARREVQRLAGELDQSLRLAQASIATGSRAAAAPADDLLGPQHALIAALTLPFELRPIAHDAPGVAAAPPGQWLPGLAQQDGQRWYLPLIWRQSAADGGLAYEVRLSREAVLARFASEGLPAGGSMSLFRLEDDGATTVLVRHPTVEREQGLTVRGHLADAVARAPSGVFQATAVIDGIPRIVGYHRLDHGAQRLVVVYALSVQGVLAAWTATLPLAIALTLLVAAAMAYGAWRLDRSLQALQRSERHFQTLTGHLPDVVARYDRQGRVLYVNAAVQAANGLTPDAMIGRTLTELQTPPQALSMWMACLERVFSSGQSETLYFDYAGPSGTRHWEAQASLEPVSPGDPPTVLVINRDITTRHNAEQQRLAAQRLFESVFQAAPEAMSLSEWATGRLLLVNDAFCELFGRTREALVGHTSLELGLWPDPQHRQQVMDALARGETVREASDTSTRPDGQVIDVRFSAEQVQVDGQPRLLLMFRDVTQHKRAQEALRRSEQRFRLAAAHGQVWEWDFGGGFIQPCDEFFVALGHPAPPQDQMGQRLLDLMHPEDLPRLRQALLAFFKGTADYRLEFRARDAQGGYHWFDTRGSGLRDPDGRVTYMAGTWFDITDRKQLEQAQRQTLKHLDTVANASASLAWTVDEHQRPDWFNQPWLDFTGRDLQSECKAPWLDDVHPQDRDNSARVFNSAFEARKPYSKEFRLRRHDGVYRWLHEQGTPRYDADQRFIGYIGSCLDVTDLREAETSARERGAMLKQVFDVLQDMLFVVDAQERFVFFQAGSGERLYRKPEDFLGQSIAQVMPPDLTDTMRAAMSRARHAGLQEVDYSLPLPDGLHHFSGRLAWLPDGEHCMFVVRDTSEQHAAQRERERMNQFVLLLFRLASRFINLPVQQMDQAIDAALGDMGVFVNADRAYLFDYDMQAGTASNTHEWCAPGVLAQKELLQNMPIARLPDWYQAHLRGQKIQVPDVQALPPGPLRSLLEPLGVRSLLTLPLMNGDTCLGFVGLDAVDHARDYGSEEITLLELFAQMLVNMRLRAQAAAQVRELTEQLEQKVDERTRQLNESVQRLQTVNRELESFTYSASHDLRTPLRGIEGFSTLLLEEHAAQLDELGREYLQRIQRATLHMSQLVNDLLAYSRLQQLTEQIEAVALAACVREVTAPFRDELEARQGQLYVQIPEHLRVRADPKGLAIALRNLIDNALKFTPAGQPPLIHIEAQAQGDRVQLRVADHGMGFDMRYHDRIFGMFQRLHRQDQIPGTGIGLALVQKAVDRMGGHIRAESTPGQGARFFIELPQA